MATSTRIRGNSGVVFTIKKSVGSAVAFNEDAKEILITGVDKDDNDITFADVADGAVQNPNLKIKAVQSTVSTSLHQFLLDNLGEVVEIVYGPHGNASASVSQPHFKVTEVKIENIPDIGGPARKTTEGYDFDYELKSTGLLTKVTS